MHAFSFNHAKSAGNSRRTWTVFRNSAQVAEVTLVRGGEYATSPAPNRRLTPDDTSSIAAFMQLIHRHPHPKAGGTRAVCAVAS
jgi:hypothetical protein